MIFSDLTGQYTCSIWPQFEHHNALYKEKFGEWKRTPADEAEAISVPSDVYVFCQECGSREVRHNHMGNRLQRGAAICEDCKSTKIGFFVNEDKYNLEEVDNA